MEVSPAENEGGGPRPAAAGVPSAAAGDCLPGLRPRRVRGPFAAWEERLLAPLPQGTSRRFAAGFACPFRAVGFLLRHPSLLLHVIVPVLLNLTLLGLAIWGAIELAPALVGWFWAHPEGGWLAALWMVVAVLAGVLLGLLGFVLALAVAGILATPFNDLLSEKTEELLLGPREGERFVLRVFLRDTAVSIGHSLLNLLLYVLVMAPVLLLNLIPVVGTVLASAIGAVATAYFLARDMVDGPLTRRRFTYGQKVRLVRADKALMGGLGAATEVLVWIPLLNLLLLPLAVVGGALLCCRLEHNGVLHG